MRLCPARPAPRARPARRPRGAVLGGLLLAPALAAASLAAERGRPAVHKPAPPILTCAALANLRMLLREANGDHAAAAARFADPRADHLGCAMTPADRVEGVADRVTIGGAPYRCLKVKDSSLCRWAENQDVQ
ncbi:hypothetical protein M446_2174 [Methylobacterium sp. 4-46]|uniref:hypothetical protein n=1 Tax=unclassified Methylobacterium TaxID=2615210 RepID=UPI000165C956|nr:MULTISPECIES: hypothetical protein [Methylobacterium]ACA16635.1 hypothetical protein M446_2174 [Methylobacterium sp. 4-46]WFT82339.1 hypothetical protein QA634_11015 [Methylobacterium nodulans]